MLRWLLILAVALQGVVGPAWSAALAPAYAAAPAACHCCDHACACRAEPLDCACCAPSAPMTPREDDPLSPPPRPRENAAACFILEHASEHTLDLDRVLRAARATTSRSAERLRLSLPAPSAVERPRLCAWLT
ncbi:MAG: hypothetical protein SFZ24_03775 [Planctomycetota bacterium]|nr:hypothetical protein [Planctomycetota bacterium]